MYTVFEANPKTKEKIEIDNNVIIANLNRIQSQIFRCLPAREEGLDWQKPLETLAIELLGMQKLFPQLEDLVSLVCKILGLLDKDKEDDFYLYRRTIFECCGLVNKLKEQFV